MINKTLKMPLVVCGVVFVCWGAANTVAKAATRDSIYGDYLAAHVAYDGGAYDRAVDLYQSMLGHIGSFPLFVREDMFKAALNAGNLAVALAVGEHINEKSALRNDIGLIKAINSIKNKQETLAFDQISSTNMDMLPGYFEKYPYVVVRIALEVSHNLLSNAFTDVEIFKDIPFFYNLYQFYYAYILYRDGHYQEGINFLDTKGPRDLFSRLEIRLKMRLYLLADQRKDLDRYIALLKNQDLYAPDVASDISYLHQHGVFLPLFDNSKEEIATMLVLMGEQISTMRPDRALMYTRMALWLSSADFIRYHAASVLYDLEQDRDANKILQGISSHSAYYNDAMLKMVSYEMAHGEVNKALVRIKDILQKNPDSIDALSVYAHLLYQQGYYKESITAYNKVINILAYTQYSEYWMLFFERGKVYSALHQYTEAEKDLTYALTFKPGDLDIQIARAGSWIQEGKHVKRASLVLEDALDETPDDVNILLQLGMAYYKMGRMKDAQKILLEALALDPKNPDINQILGDASDALGDHHMAQLQWGRAMIYRQEFRKKS